MSSSFVRSLWPVGVGLLACVRLLAVGIGLAGGSPAWAAATPTVSAGWMHTLALKSDGSLWAWGDNSYGQLGDGTTVQRATPVRIGTGFVAVSAGFTHSLAVKDDGSLWAWGQNNYSSLGDGTTTQRNSPVLIGTGYSSVAAGLNFSVALGTDGSLYAWGACLFGQVPTGSCYNNATLKNSASRPEKIGGNYTAISAGYHHALALKEDGTLWAWGGNWLGQLGTGDNTGPAKCYGIYPCSEVPVLVGGGYKAVAAGDFMTTALKTDGSLWSWGNNDQGQLGRSAPNCEYIDVLYGGTGTRSCSGVPASIGTGYSAIGSGGNHAFAIKSDGGAWAWGYNNKGQIGDGTQTNRPSPIGIGSSYVALEGGPEHSIGIKSDGSLWGWGSNWWGQLGAGTPGAEGVAQTQVLTSGFSTGTTAASHTIATSVSPAGAGTVTCAPNPVTTGGGATCAATAATGYVFSAWSGDCSGTATCVLSSVSANQTVVATFVAQGGTSGQSFDVVATSSGGDTNLTLSASMTFASEHVGRSGEIYVAANYGDQWFFNGGSSWQTAFQPYFSGALPSTKTIPIVSGMNLGAYARLGVYVGYGIDLNEMVGGGRYRKIYTVTGGGTTEGDTYLPQALQPGISAPEVKTATVAAGQGATLVLSDGSVLALPVAGVDVSASLEVKPNTLDLSAHGVAVTGSLRELSILSVGEIVGAYGLRLAIPASEYGAINPDTLNVVRVGDLTYGGQTYGDAVIFLPVRRAADGSLSVFDPYLSRGATTTRAGRAAKKIRYVLTTFQGDLNWSESPQLLRMVPKYDDESARRIRLSGLSASEQATELGKCAQNIVVLVHGHNEDEKDGYTGRDQVGAPWNFAYKRDVWSELYKDYVYNYQANANNDCTVFYEYIYPSYRPVFSGYGNLSKDFADRLASELQSVLAAGTQPNVFIVAHSMGGLVARAGIQKMSSDMHAALQRLVTWGTPHRGSVLSSLRYVCDGPYTPKLSGGAVDWWDALSFVCANLQLDTPGARDLRWDNARPLAFADYFEASSGDADADLLSGTNIYSENIRALNAGDIYASATASRNRLNEKKYAYLYGVTAKAATSMIGLGASVTRGLIKSAATQYSAGIALGDSDGAVPVSSMTAEGVDGERVHIGNIDHEEYFNGGANAVHTAQVTQTYLRLGDGVYACPPEIASLSPAAGPVGTAVTILGKGFGTTTGTVTLNGAAATVSSWSDTQIKVLVPTGVTSGNVVVKHGVNGKQSNAKPFTVTQTTTQSGIYSCAETSGEICTEYLEVPVAQASAYGVGICPATYWNGSATVSSGLSWSATNCPTGAYASCKRSGGYWGTKVSYIYTNTWLDDYKRNCESDGGLHQTLR